MASAVPNYEGTMFKPGEQQSEIARKGAYASAEAKRKRKTLKEELLLLLEEGDTQKNVSVALINKVLAGDVQAFNTLRDTIGEKPIEKVEANLSADINVDIEE